MAGMADSKARRKRRSFSDEFKAGAVRLAFDEGKAVMAVAWDLDLVPSALGGWVKQAHLESRNLTDGYWF